VCVCVRIREQESFVNISVPKIEKDYSLYRTYVIFRTLGLRHLVVVDVHNRIVGLITRKDLMPFNMQERLESLLEQQTAEDNGCEPNSDNRRKSTYDLKSLPNSADRHSHVLLPFIEKNLSANKTMLDGLEENDGTDSVEDDDSEMDSATPVEIVVSALPKRDKSEWV